MDFFMGREGRLAPSDAAAALILVEDDRYLMQLRDQKPGIFYPGHWGLFGGATEPGETPEAAVRRELREELRLTVSDIQHLTDFSFTIGRFGQINRHYFQVRIPSSAIRLLNLHEGAEMRTFLATEILNLARVVPYDSFAIWLHANGMLRQ